MEITPEIQAMLDGVAEKAADSAVKAFAASAPAKPAEISITKDEADQPWATAGEFFMAVKIAATYPNQMDSRLLPLKATGLNEAIPAQGGFLVTPQFAPGILEKMHSTGSVLAAFRPSTPVAGNSMTFNVLDETSRALGSRWGGITGYWLNEGGTKTASTPAFRQLELKLKKICALVYATDELLEDAAALQAKIYDWVPQELRFQIEDSFINGNGVGKPLGVLLSPALIHVTRNDATEIDADDIASMWARRFVGYNDYIWLCNPSVYPQLFQLTVGQVPVFLPAGMYSDSPYGRLLGRPLIETEYNPTLGEVGDLLLVSPSAYESIEKSGGVQAASSIHVAFTTDESVFRFVYRIDGAPSWNASLTGFDTNTYSPFVSLTTST